MTEIRERWLSPSLQPNGLQAAPDGLWLIDQSDSHLYKLSYDDGAVLERLPTATDRPSGVTLTDPNLGDEDDHDERIWVSSTYDAKIVMMDTKGHTIESFDTPGKGRVSFAAEPNPPVTGAHGLEWIDDYNMWITVPPAKRLFLVDPETMNIKHTVRTPGERPHGLFLRHGYLWVADTQMRKIHQLSPDDGEVIDVIDVPDPEVHGMTYHEGEIWFCCAETRRVCTIQLPD